MFITVDILQKRGACQEYLDFFQKRYPDGVEMLHMIEHGHMPYHALHWGYKWLDPNEEEINAYWKRVAVENSEGVDESDHVTNSSLVVSSSKVANCSYIIGSKEINNCEHIHDSEMVDNSSYIASSFFIDNSEYILKSKNVENSSQIVDSVYVANSHGIMDSNNIISGHTIWRGRDLTECSFCYNCARLSNSLFCLNKEDGEYLLFNKPIDKMRFEMISKQFKRYVSDFTIMTDGWSDDLHSASARKVLDYRKHTKNIPDAFWNWVKTLPGYDSDIIYALTFNPQFLN